MTKRPPLNFSASRLPRLDQSSFVSSTPSRFLWLFRRLSFHRRAVNMSSISRSANLLLRSSRASLLRPRAVNPVQHVFMKDRLAARGMASAFERSKPHVNIGRHRPLNLHLFISIQLAKRMLCRYHWSRRSRQGKKYRVLLGIPRNDPEIVPNTIQSRPP